MSMALGCVASSSGRCAGCVTEPAPPGRELRPQLGATTSRQQCGTRLTVTDALFCRAAGGGISGQGWKQAVCHQGTRGNCHRDRKSERANTARRKWPASRGTYLFHCLRRAHTMVRRKGRASGRYVMVTTAQLAPNAQPKSPLARMESDEHDTHNSPERCQDQCGQRKNFCGQGDDLKKACQITVGNNQSCRRTRRNTPHNYPELKGQTVGPAEAAVGELAYPGKRVMHAHLSCG